MKKQLIGPYKNNGREWMPEGQPELVNVYDFIDPERGKVTPYGVYDATTNTGWVGVGTDHDTAAFAVATIGHWWDQIGRAAYPGRHPAADHRRRRRIQRLPDPAVEDRPGRTHRPDHYRHPPTPGYLKLPRGCSPRP